MRTCLYNPLSLIDKPICFFPVISFVWLYSDGKPRRVKSSGIAPANARPPGSEKFANANFLEICNLSLHQYHQLMTVHTRITETSATTID